MTPERQIALEISNMALVFPPEVTGETRLRLVGVELIAAESDLSAARAEIGRLREALGAVFCYTCHRRVEEVGIRPLGCNACLNLRNALAPPAKVDAPKDNTTAVASCGHLVFVRSNGNIVAHRDANGCRCYTSETPIAMAGSNIMEPKVDAVCATCGNDGFICRATKLPWKKCDCGFCERGHGTSIPCPDCQPATPARRWRVSQGQELPHYPPKIAKDPESNCRAVAALAPGRVVEWSDDGGVTWRAE